MPNIMNLQGMNIPGGPPGSMEHGCISLISYIKGGGDAAVPPSPTQPAADANKPQTDALRVGNNPETDHWCVSLISYIDGGKGAT